MLDVQQVQPSSDCGKSNFSTVSVQGPPSVWSTLIVNAVNYQSLYKVDSTLVHSKKSLLIVKLGSFQNESIEIMQIYFVYQQNRFTVIVVLMNRKSSNSEGNRLRVNSLFLECRML